MSRSCRHLFLSLIICLPDCLAIANHAQRRAILGVNDNLIAHLQRNRRDDLSHAAEWVAGQIGALPFWFSLPPLPGRHSLRAVLSPFVYILTHRAICA